MNKFLIVGLGNPGSEYDNTRHNIGFKILDSLSDSLKVPFESSRLAFTAEGKIKGKTFFLVKPTTFMNLSGKAVNYYLQKEKIPPQNLLVITDDVALPLGALRLRPKGSDGGHNGLKNINEVLGNGNYSRLRLTLNRRCFRHWDSNCHLGCRSRIPVSYPIDPLKYIQKFHSDCW